MENSSSSSPSALAGVEYAGFWKRLVAVVIDIMILIVVIAPIELAFFGKKYLERAMAGETLLVDLFVQLVLPIVIALFFWRYAKGTPGLLAVGAEIVDAKTGAPVSTGRLLARAVCLALLVALIPLVIGLLGLLWIAFDKRKQGLHDKVAGTVVVYSD